jgi:hypothetical protein
MGIHDFPPADDSAFDPDEDLFDFPVSDNTAKPSGSTPENEVEEPSASASNLSDDDVDSLDAPIPSAEQSPAQPEAGHDFEYDVDEDIFNFPAIEHPAQVAADLTDEASDPSDPVAGFDPMNDLLEDDLGEMIRETHAEQQQDAAFVQAEEPPAALPSEAAPVAHEKQRPEIEVPAQLQAVPVVAGSQRALWVMTAAVILFMVGILSIAWRATSFFQQQIEDVRENVKSQATGLQQESAASAAQFVRLEAELEAARRDAEALAESPMHSMKGFASQAAHDRDLYMARQLLTDGQFDDSRRVLFGLLTEADRLPADARDRVEQESRFLIARSYVTEAEALPGGSK